MTLVIDLVRALREPEYRDEISEELETDMTEYVRLEAADRIEALEARLEKAREAQRATLTAIEVALARIREWEADGLSDDNYREWGGHVEPALAQLETYANLARRTLSEIEDGT